MGLAKTVLRIFVDTTVVCAIILFLPGIPPYEHFEAQTLTPALKFEGALGPGDFVLNGAEKLFQGEILGPECLEQSPTDPDVFYTTLKQGAVVKVFNNGNKMQILSRLGQKAGRPLGIRFDASGHLIVSDAYLGIFRINVTTGETANLVPEGKVINDKPSLLFNSVAPSLDGKIYYTVSSTNYHLDDSLGEMLGSPSGRLMVFNYKTGVSTVLQEDLHFANGIVLSEDEDYLVFAECLRHRLMKYWIQGPKAGTMEVFLDGLPGTPDNLSFSPNGNIMVALVTVRMPGEFNPTEFLYGQPLIRKLLLRLMYFVKIPLQMATSYLDFPILHQMNLYLMSFESVLPFVPSYAVVMEIDWQGKILDSWHSNQPDLRFYSEAKIINGYMYLASPYNDYLGRVRMNSYYLDEPILSVG